MPPPRRRLSPRGHHGIKALARCLLVVPKGVSAFNYNYPQYANSFPPVPVQTSFVPPVQLGYAAPWTATAAQRRALPRPTPLGILQQRFRSKSGGARRIPPSSGKTALPNAAAAAAPPSLEAELPSPNIFPRRKLLVCNAVPDFASGVSITRNNVALKNKTPIRFNECRFVQGKISQDDRIRFSFPSEDLTLSAGGGDLQHGVAGEGSIFQAVPQKILASTRRAVAGLLQTVGIVSQSVSVAQNGKSQLRNTGVFHSVEGTFRVERLPPSDSVLLLIVQKKSPGSVVSLLQESAEQLQERQSLNLLSFQSFAFAPTNNRDAQVAFLNAVPHDAQAKLNMADAHETGKVTRKEKVLFNRVYAVAAGDYEIGDGEKRRLRLLPNKDYVVVKTGDALPLPGAAGAAGQDDGAVQNRLQKTSLLVFPDDYTDHSEVRLLYFLQMLALFGPMLVVGMLLGGWVREEKARMGAFVRERWRRLRPAEEGGGADAVRDGAGEDAGRVDEQTDEDQAALFARALARIRGAPPPARVENLEEEAQARRAEGTNYRGGNGATATITGEDGRTAVLARGQAADETSSTPASRVAEALAALRRDAGARGFDRRALEEHSFRV